MKLPFLDRHEEAARFRRLVDRSEGSLGVVYGRRRCGKSRLLREVLPLERSPFGEEPRGSKRTLYKISDPFLRFWFRYVDVNRSRLGAGQVAAVEEEIGRRLGPHIGDVWEELARASVSRLHLGGRTWGPAGRWWGPGLDRQPLEVDLVAYSSDGGSVLVGEVKWATPRDAERLLDELGAKARRLPLTTGREVVLALWLKAPVDAAGNVLTPRQVLDVLR